MGTIRRLAAEPRCALAMELLLAFGLALSGCAGSNLPAWTAAQVGCPTDEVVVTKEEKVWSTRTWTARCRGKTYSCTESHEGQPGATVSCKERGDDAATGPAESSDP